MNEYVKVDLNSLVLLYVEDDFDIRRSTHNVFKKFFKEILIASDGKEGLALFEEYQHKIDLVLTDINMPIMNGIEMSRRIKQKNPNIPIVITTAYSDKNYLMDAITIGISEYAIKPITVQDLLAKIKKAYFPLYQSNQIKLQEALLSEQSRNAQIGKIMLNVAHQWRQPLNELSLLIQSYRYAHERGLLEEKLDEFTNKGIAVIKKMSETIDDFMNFFNPTKTKKLFNITECVEEVLYYTGSIFSINKISLELDLQSNFALFGYKREFQEVLINILNNAKDEIIIKNVVDGKIKISSYSKDNKNYLSIFNNHSYIEPANLSKLFQPFFTTKQAHNGTGLGLYIVFDIVHNHLDGTIEAKNSDDGVVFILAFDEVRTAK